MEPVSIKAGRASKTTGAFQIHSREQEYHESTFRIVLLVTVTATEYKQKTIISEAVGIIKCFVGYVSNIDEL